MKSVLHGFLGTFTSRNSDHQGFWLHGQLPQSQEEWTIDLLQCAPSSKEVVGIVQRLAVRRFADQVRKAGLSLDVVREASLQITRMPGVVRGDHGGPVSEGRMVRFAARSMMDNGRIYRDECTVFVAPHDPEKELRRAEEDWGPDGHSYVHRTHMSLELEILDQALTGPMQLDVLRRLAPTTDRFRQAIRGLLHAGDLQLINSAGVPIPDWASGEFLREDWSPNDLARYRAQVTDQGARRVE